MKRGKNGAEFSFDDDEHDERCTDFMETNPFNISAKMPAMLDSILVKNLGENRLSQTDTVSSCI